MTAEQVRPDGLVTARRALSKVPEVTAVFWVIKILTTGMGEVTSDYFLLDLADPSVVVQVAFVALVVALVAQILTRRHIPWLYWTTVVLVSVVGTMVADILHYLLDVSFADATMGFAVALAVILGAWYATERTLSIQRIHTRRREVFYWLTVMATFALGTAAGDLVADTGDLGFLGATVVFAAAMAVAALAWRKFGLNAIAAFWIAYILTRPLGASAADLFGMPAGNGGLGFGLGPVSLALTVAIIALVGFVSLRRAGRPVG